jgi:MinD-like ATPase involved in chromosome partitioning or flagellar assembly
VVSADLPQLDREAVSRLHSCGVAVVALVAPGDSGGLLRAPALGIGRVLPGDASPQDVAAALEAAVADLDAARPDLFDPRRDDAAMAPVHAAATPVPSPQASTSDLRPLLVAVWGPTGAPGRTTLAVTLATEFAELDRRTLLVDADTYGPSVAQALGLLEDSAGLAGAVRAALQGALDAARLAPLTSRVTPLLGVLTGLPRPDRWPELRPSGLDVVWQRCREVADVTVVDCGFGLESDEELSFDTVAPQRNGATLSAVAAADVVLAVGAGDPVGLQRLVRGLNELKSLVAPDDVRVVVTRVRASAVGSSPQRRVAQALERYAGVRHAVLIPDDRAACDAAMLAGRSLTEAAPRSPARLAIAELARGIARDRFGVPAPASAARSHPGRRRGLRARSAALLR